jgi:hypothetical protein
VLHIFFIFLNTKKLRIKIKGKVICILTHCIKYVHKKQGCKVKNAFLIMAVKYIYKQQNPHWSCLEYKSLGHDPNLVTFETYSHIAS